MEETTTLSNSAQKRPIFFELIKTKIETLAASRAMFVAIVLYLLSLVALNISDYQIKQVAPGIPKPDLVFGYTYTDIMDIFNRLGEAGRQAYAVNLIVDSIMPVLFAAAVILVVVRAFPRFWLPLSIAPFMFFILDMIENVAFAQMISQFPNIDVSLVAFTRPLTMIKLISFMIAMPSMGIGAIMILIRWARVRRAVGK
jgi:hypothetical protein